MNAPTIKRARKSRYSRPQGSILKIDRARVETYKLKFELPGALPGKRRTAYKTVKGSRDDAKAALRKELDRVQTGILVNDAKQPFVVWARAWLRDMAHEVSQRTLEGYTEKLEKTRFPISRG